MIDLYTILLNRFIIDGKLSRNRLTKSHEGKLFLQSTKHLYGADRTQAEIAYLIYHRLLDQPGCKCCGKKACKFISFTEGYLSYCSQSCSSKSNGAGTKLGEYVKTDEFKEKRRVALIKHFGTDSMVEVNHEKIKKSSLERYGVDHPLKAQATKDKRVSSMLKLRCSLSLPNFKCCRED